MSSESTACPGCGAQFDFKQKLCPQCGRWTAARGIAFYIFWVALALIVIALMCFIFHAGFVTLTRVL